MIITILFYLLTFAILFAIVYTLYKSIWYAVKWIVFRTNLSALTKDGVKITWHRKPIQMVFRQKGQFDLTIDTRRNTYHIAILTSISTHSRWNVMKGKNHYYFEVRRPKKIFYDVNVHSGNNSEMSYDYLKEERFSLSQLDLEESKFFRENEKKILLVYPTPKTITYTDHQVNYLKSGSTVCGYEVFYLKDLLNEIMLCMR